MNDKEEKKLKQRNDNIAAAKAELEAAVEWLQSIPTDCDALAIAEKEAIVAHWPDRIARLVANRGG